MCEILKKKNIYETAVEQERGQKQKAGWERGGRAKAAVACSWVLPGTHKAMRTTYLQCSKNNNIREAVSSALGHTIFSIVPHN